ncbi:MAG: CU044_2847 family protein [Myxococcota bacterium]
MLLEVLLKDDTYVLIDAEPAIGIDKGGGNIAPPQEALNSMLVLGGQMMSRLVELTRGEAAPDEMSATFGLRVDSNGTVSIAKNLNEAQIQVSARWTRS